MVEEEEPIESLADILGELWGEFQKKGGAAHLFEELVEFLEDQDDVTSNRVSSTGGQAQKMGAVNQLTEQEQVVPSTSSVVDIELAKLKKQMGIK
jgi:hypothetical protein